MDDAPGWDAIDAALVAVYGSAVPRHVGYHPPAAFSTNLQGCSAYRSGEHWHYVTYGLSELYVAGPDDDPEFSGWGFELTMRVPGVGDAAPEWPFTMINEMAKYVNGQRALLEVGHHIDLRAPVTGHPHVPTAPPTGLTVYAVATDPVLGTIDTPNGAVEFLQLVGVTGAERDAMGATATADVLATLAERDPWLLTDPQRA